MVYYCVHKQFKYLRMQSNILQNRREYVILNRKSDKTCFKKIGQGKTDEKAFNNT